MDTEITTTKKIIELEQQIAQLLKTLHSAKLKDHPIYAELYEFAKELGEVRRTRFDKENPEFRGY